MNFKMEEQDVSAGDNEMTERETVSSISSSSSSSSSTISSTKTKEETIAITNYHFPPSFAMFGYKERIAFFDDYGEQLPLTPYMDDIALHNATSIDFLVEDDVDEAGAPDKKRKKWKNRMIGNEEEEEDEEEDEDDHMPKQIMTEEIELEIKCR